MPVVFRTIVDCQSCHICSTQQLLLTVWPSWSPASSADTSCSLFMTHLPYLGLCSGTGENRPKPRRDMLRVTGGSVRAPGCCLFWSLLLLTGALLDTRRGSLPCSRADVGLLTPAVPASTNQCAVLNDGAYATGKSQSHPLQGTLSKKTGWLHQRREGRKPDSILTWFCCCSHGLAPHWNRLAPCCNGWEG